MKFECAMIELFGAKTQSYGSTNRKY
uniref:Uncharacterized protein n=1 Tax=Arundo donax TaxID=35708 RepID=A0A0A8YHX9_ARUDO